MYGRIASHSRYAAAAAAAAAADTLGNKFKVLRPTPLPLFLSPQSRNRRRRARKGKEKEKILAWKKLLFGAAVNVRRHGAIGSSQQVRRRRRRYLMAAFCRRKKREIFPPYTDRSGNSGFFLKICQP